MLYGDGIHDDTLALQQLLDRKGIVTVDRPGIYLVSRTLIIRSDTRFVLSPGAKLLAAPMSRCALIENEHFAGGGRDRNIEIIGGVWDGNCDSMGLDAVYEAIHREDQPYSPGLFKGKLIRFARVDRIMLEKMTVRNPVSYGIQIADVDGFVVRDLSFDYNCHFGTTVGEIANVDIRNLTAVNGYSGVRLLSAGNFDMRCIRISGVYGEYRHNAVLISHHNTRPNTRIWFDDITIEHVHAVKCPTPLPDDCFRYWEGSNHRLPVVWIETGIAAGLITLRDITRHEKHSTDGLLLQIDNGAQIDRLILDNIHQSMDPGVTAPFIINEASVGTLIERDIG